jgi:hypothetical protein
MGNVLVLRAVRALCPGSEITVNKLLPFPADVTERQILLRMEKIIPMDKTCYCRLCASGRENYAKGQDFGRKAVSILSSNEFDLMKQLEKIITEYLNPATTLSVFHSLMKIVELPSDLGAREVKIKSLKFLVSKTMFLTEAGPLAEFIPELWKAPFMLALLVCKPQSEGDSSAAAVTEEFLLFSRSLYIMHYPARTLKLDFLNFLEAIEKTGDEKGRIQCREMASLLKKFRDD